MKQQDIGYLLKLIDDKMKISSDESLKEIGMTISQVRVIEFLDEMGGQATQKEIENHLEVSHPTVVGIVSRLEKNGFLSCHVDKSDRRNKIVCITEKAAEKSEKMYKSRAESEKRLLKSLSAEETAELRLLRFFLRYLRWYLKCLKKCRACQSGILIQIHTEIS